MFKCPDSLVLLGPQSKVCHLCLPPVHPIILVLNPERLPQELRT